MTTAPAAAPRDELARAFLAVAEPPRGVPAASDDLARTVGQIDGDSVLLDHSYRGMVDTDAATGNARVTALVAIGALAPDIGESAVDLSGRLDGGTLAETLAVTHRPIVDAALGEPSGRPSWRTIPSWRLFGPEDHNIPAAAHRSMAGRASSQRTVEITGGAHTVAIPGAPTMVDLIREAAVVSVAS